MDKLLHPLYIAGEITYPFPNNSVAVEVWEWISNSSHIYWACDHLSMLGLKVIHVSKGGPGVKIY